MNHPHVGNIRGRGLMLGVELVSDKSSRKPLTAEVPQLNAELPRYLQKEHGILLGIRNSAIIITPTLIINADEVSRICEALIKAGSHLDTVDFSLPVV
jgi:putrescine aminotransferase